MKAGLRKRKKQLEMEQNLKKMSESSKNEEVPKKKLISIPSQKSNTIKKQENIDDMNIIQNIPASRPANNVDVDKISQRVKEKLEKRKRKNKKNNIEPVFIDQNMNNNINNNENNMNNNINNNINNDENINNQKDNKNLYDSESVAPVLGIQNNKINNNQSDKNLNVNNNNNKKIISVSSSKHSYNNKDNKDNQTSLSNPNYLFLSKNYNDIKYENIKEFLDKTNPNKPSNEQKEYEIQKMIKLMEFKPKAVDIKKNKEDENNFPYNLIQKMESDKEYNENQKEIKKLKGKIKEEEDQIEYMLKNNKEEIEQYIEKIIELQNELLNSQKGDIFYLEEENKIDKIQIENLSSAYQRLMEENKKEKEKINKLIIFEIPKLTKELEKEIEKVKKMKHQIEVLGKKKPPSDIMKKIEVVMRYMKKK